MYVLTFTSIIMSTLAADLTPHVMSCIDDGTPSTANFDQPLLWYKAGGYFLNGMESYHDNGPEDRRFSMRYCATANRIISDAQVVPWTDYDSSWRRGCGGASAIYYAYSIHDNGAEDRTFAFICGGTSNDLILDSCEWNGYYPSSFDGGIHFDCPNNGIIRTLQSYHDNGAEDRKFKFECCQVYENPYAYISMTCTENDFYSNEWDGSHSNLRSGYFLSGMESEHNNGPEDRRFKWKYCKPTTGTYVSQEELDVTSYDAEWTKSCGENAAMISAYSTHNNGPEDREWTFKCGVLNIEDYQLVNCGWTGELNTLDDALNFHCPNNGVIRGIWSKHYNSEEDRLWRFDCCQIAERNYLFTNKNGYWIEKVSLGGAGTISKSLATGISRTDSKSVTETFSRSLSVAITAGYTYTSGFHSGSFSVTVTGTVSASTANTISQSLTQTEEETITVTCGANVQYLYQFIVETDQATVETHQYRCTNIQYPACGPGFFNCAIGDPNCNTCKSNWPSA